MPLVRPDERLRTLGRAAILGLTRCFVVCVEKSVPVASGAWHGQVWVKVLAR
jgi:hypothetical protein